MRKWYLFSALCALLVLKSSAQQSVTDSLQRVLPSLHGKERLSVLSDLCYYLSASDVATAEGYGREALQLARQLNDSALIASAANDLSTCLYRKGDYAGALQYTRQALHLRALLGDKAGMGSSYNKLLNIYNDKAQLDSALHYGLLAVRIYEESGDTLRTAISLNSLASIYTKEREWSTCIKYAQQAYDLASKINHPYPLAGAAGNIALANEEMGHSDEAIKWYSEALRNFELLNSQVDIATVSANLGVLYRKKGEWLKAKDAYTKALTISEAVGERNGIAHYNANLGSVNIDLKNYSEAEKNFATALAIAEAENLGRIRLNCYDGLAKLYALTGRGTQSYQMVERYKTLRDSLYNSEKSEQLTEMRTRYETEKKEQENLLLQQENELKNRENRLLLFGSVIIIALLVASGLFYYRAYKRKQESRMQAALVAEREAGLRAVFDATESERKRIARDLHDGIGQLLGGLKLGWESLRNQKAGTDDAQMQQLTRVLDEAAGEVRSISHRMMPKALQEQGLLPALDDMLRNSLGVAGVHYKLEHHKVEGQRFDERIELALFRVAQELVSNILKHSGAAEVNVQFYRNKNQLLLIIEDNGRGFDPNAKRDGIGLLNITSRLGTVNGEITWERGPEKGTVATVRVPLE